MNSQRFDEARTPRSPCPERWECSRRHLLKTGGALLTTALLGPTAWSAEPNTILSFGMITDLHYADANPRGTRFYRDSIAKLAECTDLMNKQKVDFLIQVGDFKDQADQPSEETTLGYLKTIESAFSKFNGPRYYVLGNHDLDSISKPQFIQHTKMEKNHYSFERSGARFIVLDANFKANDQDYDRGNYNFLETRVPPEQLKWLESELGAATGPVIVFVHQRLDGTGSVFVNNAADVRQVLEKSRKVHAVFQGHDHRGDYRAINGIHYYTLKGAVEGPGAENNSYANVLLRSDETLELTGYRRAITKTM